MRPQGLEVFGVRVKGQSKSENVTALVFQRSHCDKNLCSLSILLMRSARSNRPRFLSDNCILPLSPGVISCNFYARRDCKKFSTPNIGLL
jgi:hypothetical protein